MDQFLMELRSTTSGVSDRGVSILARSNGGYVLLA